VETTLRWGVMGTARIARKALIPAILSAPGHRLVAIASRDVAKGQAFASQFANAGPLTVHGSYAALLADPSVEAIYIPLPNALHAPWAIRALEAGKHVLCEKPLALNAAEAQQMIEVARQRERVLMEAFMYRFHPRIEALVSMLRRGAFGEVRYLQADFSFPLHDANDIRLDPELGGGALMDIGCYPLNLARTLLDAEPLRVEAHARFSARGVDRDLIATLHFPHSSRAQIACSFEGARSETLTLVGSLGSAHLRHAFVPTGTEVLLDCSYSDGRQERLHFPASDPYRRMIEHFAAVVHGATPPRYDPLEARANMAAIDALYASAHQQATPHPPVS
jgi:D-xylose 1-dehydrogenase (NADP+, D-xylono-1,5-lactone-forming)